MNLNEKLIYFNELHYKIQLDSWETLLNIVIEFLNTRNKDLDLAKRIANQIYNHRGIMGASKAYEQAFEIDTELLFYSILIARIGFGETKELVPYLKSGLYYSDELPEKFNKMELEKEIKDIEDNLPLKKKYMSKKERREMNK